MDKMGMWKSRPLFNNTLHKIGCHVKKPSYLTSQSHSTVCMNYQRASNWFNIS